MFRKLRNKLILINLGITSAVILTVFTMIYVISTNVAKNRPPVFNGFSIQTAEDEINDDVERIVTLTIREEKDAAARDLSIMLIVSGIAIEIAVALVSYYMAEQAIKPIKDTYESQKIFIANASHEIKTPIAAISANLEAADIKNNRFISNVEFETAKLAKLNNELLTLARTDIVSEITKQDVNLKKMILDALGSLEPRMKNINFTSKIDLPENVKINSADYMQIFGILMDNAIKYCDKKIKVEINEHKVMILNDGKKIKKDEIEHIFDRFYQADKSSEGVGLGLSIAKSLAEKNGWNLSVESDKNTVFLLGL